MALICYHASHEQFAPSALLNYTIMAEQAGFDGIHSSDHFHPWSERQGQSGFSFSWIAAAMQATTLPFSMVCAPGQRYHPAIVAQAFATLCELFPGRINFELGSGEAVNEIITGDEWPAKQTRNSRLRKCVTVIRRLLTGEEVHCEDHVKVKGARLYTLPVTKPLLLCAAISEETSAWAGEWADGLLTTAEQQIDNTVKKINAFYSNGGNHKPVYLQYSFSYARQKSVAEEEAYHQWRTNIIPKDKLGSIDTVKAFDEAGENISKEEVLAAIPVYTGIEALYNEIGMLATTGAERIILHNVSRRQKEFIEDYGKFRNV